MTENRFTAIVKKKGKIPEMCKRCAEDWAKVGKECPYYVDDKTCTLEGEIAG